MSHVLRAQGSTWSALGYRVQRGPNVSVHYSTAAAGPGPRTFSLTRDKETLQTLNGRLEVYLNQVQNLDSVNQTLEQQIQEELDRKCPRHLRGPDHHLRGLDHHLRTASHLQNQICRCLSVQSELKLKLLGAELTVADVKDRLDREHDHRHRLEAELVDLKVFWEELKNHHLPELQGQIDAQTQQLAKLKTQHKQDLQGLLVQGSGGVTVKMQDVQASDLSQQLNHQRNVSRFNVQVSMMGHPGEPLRSLGGSEVAELMELRRSAANLETELNQLQAVNVMLEASALQKSQSYVLQLGVLQQRADVLCTDLDSVLQAAAQKAKDHEALLDIKNQLEAEIQDYKRLLDGLNIQRVSNSNPVVASFHNAFIPASRNIPVRVQRGTVEIAAVQPVSRGHISFSRPQPLETVTRFQPVQHLHGSATIKEVSLPSTKSQNVAGRQDKKLLEVKQETKQSGQIVSLKSVDSVETGRDGDEGSTAVFDMIGSVVYKSVASQGKDSVEKKVQVVRLDQRLLVSDVSLSKKVTKNRDPRLGRPEELQTSSKTVVSKSSVTLTPRTELRKPSVDVKETETVVLASGSEDSQVSGEVSLVDEKNRKGPDKMDEEEEVRLDGISHGVRLDPSSLSDVSMIKQVTDSESGTSADLQTNTRTGISGTRDLLNTGIVGILPETSQMDEKDMIRQKKKVEEKQVVVGGSSQDAGTESGRPSDLQTNAKTGVSGTRDLLDAQIEMYLTQTVKTEPNEPVTEKDKNVKEKKVEEFEAEGPSLPLKFNQSLSDSSVTKQGEVIESGSQTTTCSINSSTTILSEEKHEGLADNDNKEAEQEVEEGTSHAVRLGPGLSLKGELIGRKNKVTQDEELMSERPAELQTNAPIGTSGTRDVLSADVGLQESGAPAGVQVMKDTPAVISSLSKEVLDKDERVQQGKKGEENQVVVGGSSYDADSGSGRPADLQTSARTGISGTRDLLNTEIVVILPETSLMGEKEMERQEKKVEEKQVVVGGSSQDVGSGSRRPSDLDAQVEIYLKQTMKTEKYKNVKEKKVEEFDAQAPSLPLKFNQSLSDSSVTKQSEVSESGSQTTTCSTKSGRPAELQTDVPTGTNGTRDVLSADVGLQESGAPAGVQVMKETPAVISSLSNEVSDKDERVQQGKKGEENQVVVGGSLQVVGTESGRPSDLQTNAKSGVSGTRDLLGAQIEKYLTQTVKTESNEPVTEKDKNVKEKKVEEFEAEGPSLPLKFNQSLSDSSVTKQSKLAGSGSQTRSTNATMKILNEAKIHEGIPDNGFHDTSDLKTCPSEVVSEVVAQTGQDAKKSLSLTDSGVVCVSSSEPEPDVDPVLSPKDAEIDLDTVETEEFMMDEVFGPVDLKDHPELFLDPNDSEMFLFQHDSEICPNDEDDDEEFCLTEANVNVRPVEKYILSTKESPSICSSGDGDVPDEDRNRNVMVSVEVRDSFGSLVRSERDSEFGEGIITDKEEQLGFGSDRNNGNACGFADKVLGPGVVEGVDVNCGNTDTGASFDGKGGKPSGRVSGKVGSFGQTNTGRREDHFVTTVSAKQTVRVGSRASGEQMVYGGQPRRMSSGAGRSSVNSAESRASSLVTKQLSTSPQGAVRFGRRGSGDWTVYGGPAGGGTNHPSSALPVVGSRSESTHLPVSPLEKGRIGRRDSGEWVLYDRNRLQSAESEGSLPVVPQLATSPPGPGRFSRKGSGEHVLYGGSLIRWNSFDGTWVETGPSLVMNPPDPWSGRRGSGEGVVFGGLQRTHSSDIEQFPTESPHLMSPPGAARFRRGSGDRVVYGRSEERTPVTRQRATSSSGAPKAGRFSGEEDREQKVYGTNPGGVVRRSGSVGSGGRLTRSSSSGESSGNRRSSVGSVGRPGGGAIISTNRAPSPGVRMSFSGGSGGWSTSLTAAAKRISRAGSSDRLSGGRVRSSSVSSGGGGRVITSSSRSTGSTGSRSNRDRISVCKMAAMSMSAAGKERSQDQQRQHQREAEPAPDVPSAAAAVQRWLTSGDHRAKPDRPDGSA